MRRASMLVMLAIIDIGYVIERFNRRKCTLLLIAGSERRIERPKAVSNHLSVLVILNETISTVTRYRDRSISRYLSYCLSAGRGSRRFTREKAKKGEQRAMWRMRTSGSAKPRFQVCTGRC